MSEPSSDGLVFFGATGDLAYKKIFPALQGMVRRGHLSAPVVGVAKAGWNLDQFKARARDSVEKHGGLDPAAFARLSTLYEASPPPNFLRFRISPDVCIGLGVRAKSPGERMDGGPVELQVCRHDEPNSMGAYERLLTEAMKGDATDFAREDYVEAAWRVVDPVLGDVTPLNQYEPGTWGPREAGPGLAPPGGWQDPVLEPEGGSRA
jgi:glucose-6-phosphate 1-dehydrogenase